jgi:hypothetical protein
MILGAGIFSHLYPVLKKTVLTWGDLGKITVPQFLHVSHWAVIPVVILGALFFFRLKGRPSSR